MKVFRYFVVLIIISIFLSGCANTGIEQINTNLYRIKNIDKSGVFGNNGVDLQNEVYAEAVSFSSKHNKLVNPVSQKYVPMAVGRFASFELVFRMKEKEIVSKIKSSIPSSYKSFLEYLEDNLNSEYEGIWETEDGKYLLGLVATPNDYRFKYKMFVLETESVNWENREIKMKIYNLEEDTFIKVKYFTESKQKVDLLCKLDYKVIDCYSRKNNTKFKLVKVSSLD